MTMHDEEYLADEAEALERARKRHTGRGGRIVERACRYGKCGLQLTSWTTYVAGSVLEALHDAGTQGLQFEDLCDGVVQIPRRDIDEALGLLRWLRLVSSRSVCGARRFFVRSDVAEVRQLDTSDCHAMSEALLCP